MSIQRDFSTKNILQFPILDKKHIFHLSFEIRITCVSRTSHRRGFCNWTCGLKGLFKGIEVKGLPEHMREASVRCSAMFSKII